MTHRAEPTKSGALLVDNLLACNSALNLSVAKRVNYVRLFGSIAQIIGGTVTTIYVIKHL